MYAQQLIMQMGPGKRPIAEAVADKYYNLYKGMKGYVSSTFLGAPEKGQYASVIIWESLEDLQAAGQIVRPIFEKDEGGKLQGPPIIEIYEVYEPK